MPESLGLLVGGSNGLGGAEHNTKSLSFFLDSHLIP